MFSDKIISIILERKTDMNINEQIGLDRNANIKTNNGLRMKAILTELIYFAAAAVLGRAQLPFEAFPFGFSALCVPSGMHTLFALAGLCISLIGRSKPYIYIGAYAVALLVRFAFSFTVHDVSANGKIKWLNEHVSLRAVAAATGAFALGMYRLTTGGFLYYDLFGAVISIILSAVGTAIIFPTEKRKGGAFIRAVSLVALLSAVTWGLRGLNFYGVGMSAFFAMLASLAVTRKSGITQGAFAALATGLCVSPDYAPLFVFGVLAYGFLSSVTPFFGATAALAAGMAWGLYIGGLKSFTELFPALIAADFIFLTVDRLYIGANVQKPTAALEQTHTDVQKSEADIYMLRMNDTAERIKALCTCLSSLSDMLVRTDVAEAEENLSYEVGELITVDSDVQYCERYFADALRSASLASDLKAVSEYIAGIMVENESRFIKDSEMSERLDAALAENGINGIFVSAFGEADKRITLCADRAELIAKHRETIIRCIEKNCGYAVTAGEIEYFGEKAFAVFERAPILKASISGRKRGCEGESTFCGDSFGTVCGGGKTYAFISDGMGSGREAEITSGLCALFLQKLLPINNFAGDCARVTLEALNSFLCSRNGAGFRECSATVDIASLDLVACRGTFYKSGAAPTYIFRDGSLFKVHARTAPIGIVREPDIGKISMELIPGDVIIMVSDGVTMGKEECPKLFELLRTRVITHSADELAEAVMDYAAENNCTDDVSVLVMKLEENLKLENVFN